MHDLTFVRSWFVFGSAFRLIFPELSLSTALLRLIRLIEEEVGGQLLVLIACKVCLNNKIALEAEAA